MLECLADDVPSPAAEDVSLANTGRPPLFATVSYLCVQNNCVDVYVHVKICSFICA